MPSRDELYSRVEAVNAFDVQEITTDTTTVGDAINLEGFESAMLLLQAGTLTDGTYTPLLEEADPTVENGDTPGSYSAVADADLLGTEAGAAFAATDDNKVTKLGYRGDKKFIRLSIVSASTSSGGFVGATCVKGLPVHQPKSTQKP